MNFFTLLFSGFLAVAVSGCASSTGNNMSAHDSISQQYPTLVRGMADTAITELVQQYPPEKTAITLNKVPGLFGETLETGLRGQGFALLPPETPGIQVSYVLDALSGEDTPTAYLRVHTSDGRQFSVIRRLQENPANPSGTSHVTSSPLSNSTIAPSPAPRTGSQNTLLPKAVLTVLPYDWRYQIPDMSKRSLRVGWPKNVPWRESIRAMATEAGCEARFDESARRVTLISIDTPRRVRQEATAFMPVAPVSALHPASLPEAVPTPPASKPEVKVEVPTQEPAVIQDALGGGVSAPAATPASAMPEVLPVIPASSLASVPHLPPAKTEESDGSNSLLLQAQKSKASLPEEIWTLTPGSLYANIEQWADRAGYTLIWKSAGDLTMKANVAFSGSFLDAVKQLFGGLSKSGHNLRVTLYQTNKVMEVSDK